MSRLSEEAAKLDRKVLALGRCCSRVEGDFGKNRLSATDVELVYSSTFLSVVAAWEGFVETALTECVCGPRSKKRGNGRLVEFRSRTALRNLLLHPNKKYVSIPSLADAESLMELFVSKGRPFSEVCEANRTRLQQAGWIRNAIAHQSGYALKVFREKVPGVSALPPPKRRPGAFLRHVFRTSPSQRRYDIYFAAFRAATLELRRAWE